MDGHRKAGAALVFKPEVGLARVAHTGRNTHTHRQTLVEHIVNMTQ